MSEIFTEQLGVVANVVLAVFAIIAAIVAWFTFRAQSRQLASEARERRREAEERRREQAVRVYIWQDPSQTHMFVNKPPEVWISSHVRNASQQPVYGLRIGWQRAGDAFGTGTLRAAPLMPDEQDGTQTELSDADNSDVIANAVFRDRAGLWWRTYADGRLEEFGADISVTDSSGSTVRPRHRRYWQAERHGQAQAQPPVRLPAP